MRRLSADRFILEALLAALAAPEGGLPSMQPASICFSSKAEAEHIRGWASGYNITISPATPEAEHADLPLWEPATALTDTRHASEQQVGERLWQPSTTGATGFKMSRRRPIRIVARVQQNYTTGG